jgi:hypothetical protein
LYAERFPEITEHCQETFFKAARLCAAIFCDFKVFTKNSGLFLEALTLWVLIRDLRVSFLTTTPTVRPREVFHDTFVPTPSFLFDDFIPHPRTVEQLLKW